MSNKKSAPGKTPADAADLRKRAEKQAVTMEPISLSAHSPEAIQQMFHELRVHQIELELQNEELRTAQAEIEAGRARYFDLYDLAPVGYVTVSAKGLILEANLTAATLLGLSRGALVRQPISRFILKEDQDIYYLHRKTLLETGEPQECELRLMKPDHSVFWVHLAATAAQVADGTSVSRMVISDITMRKQALNMLRESEERFHSLYDSMTELVVLHEMVFDEYGKATNYKIIDCNPAFTKVTGIRREDAVGKLATDVYGTENAPYLSEYEIVVLGGEPFSFTTYFKPMEKYFEINTVSPKKNHFATIASDITDRKKVEEKIKTINEQLQLANTEKDKLFAIIAHDLRSPMSGLVVATQMLAEQPNIFSEKDIRFLATELYKNASNTFELLEDLLQWARLNQGGIRCEPTPCSLNDLMNMGLSTAQVLAKTKEISLRLDIAPGLTVLADQPMIKTVIRNILFNAIKFTPRGGEIVMTTRQAEQNLTMAIQDNGLGMNGQVLSSIFSMEKGKRQLGTDGEKGTGLGLVLCKQFIRVVPK